ncbi:MAG TPA: thiolase domain-containing protein [Nevskiaceae bacterium]|nr:thiolase domain-containing protein [Nevskiaceae bacterium]
MSRVFVEGAYQTNFGELWECSFKDLLVEAARGALGKAGVSPKQVDAIYVGSMLAEQVNDQGHLGALLSGELNLSCPAVRVEAACASGGLAVRKGFLAVASGIYETVLVVGVEKMTDACIPEVTSGLMGATDEQESLSGFTFVSIYALMAEAYKEKYGLRGKELAAVAVKNHYHASLNPRAHYRKRITVDQVLASRMVCSPLRILDCSGVTDGAAAIVLSRKKTKVEILGGGVATDSLSLSKRKRFYSMSSSQKAMQKALKETGVKRQEIDLAEVHDCFTIAEIMALEDLGFYKEGEGRRAALRKETWLDGKFPVNTSGGLKACGHPVGATGVRQIVEIVSQLQGRAGERQVKNARIGLCHNVGGSGGTAVVQMLAAR